MDELTDDEKALLTFERQWWKYPGAKETAISEQFGGISAMRYYQRLNVIIDRPEALAYDVLLVKRPRISGPSASASDRCAALGRARRGRTRHNLAGRPRLC